MSAPRLSALQPYGQAILRIVTGYVFLQYGTNKLFGIPAGAGQTGPGPAFGTLHWFAGLLELTGGALTILGLFTVPVAFILCGEMAFAYFMSHAPRGAALLPFKNGGSLSVLLCFVFLFFFVAGAGPWSMDNLIYGTRHKKK